MGIRLQPKDIEVSANKPFEYDLLDREEPIKALTTMIEATEGPRVLAVDAGWGMGKTTFINMWAQYLRDHGFPVVQFNAWETDFSESPFLALAAEITDGLEKYKALTDQARESLKKATADVLRRLPGALTRLAAASVPNIGSQLVAEGEAIRNSLAMDPTSEYRDAKGSMKWFRDTLAACASTLVKERTKPLVVVIDELDRCRPSYAVQLLEVAKHFFTVDDIVFVLAMDRDQLGKSVKVLYGAEFDSPGYLGRFFDVDYRLPMPDRKRFIDAMLNEFNSKSALDQVEPRIALRPSYAVYRILPVFLQRSDMDLRSIARVIRRLGLGMSSLDGPQLRFTLTLVVLSLLRALHPTTYREFIADIATDEEAVNAMFRGSGLPTLRGTPEGNSVEALLLVCRLGPNWRLGHSVSDKNPLLRRHSESDNPDRIQPILEEIRNLTDPFSTEFHDHIGFDECVRRLEFLEHINLGSDQ